MTSVRSRVLIAIAVAGLLAPGLGAARTTSDAVRPLTPRPVDAPCASPSYVGGLGWTCPGPNGLYRVLLGDGTSGLSHGGDPVPGHLQGGDLSAKPRNVTCVKRSDREFHLQALYVHPSDQGSRYVEKIAEIRQMLRDMNGLLYSDAREFNRSRSFRFACAGKVPSVLEVRLPSINDRQDYGQVLTEVRRAGYANALAKYVIYYDGRPPNAPGGTALMPNDERLSGNNQANFGPYYAVSWGIPRAMGGAGVLMHELGHTMGAVQDSAPNSSGAAHCNDGQDIMCYDDGGPSAKYRGNVCSTTHFDCRHNDYFHPNPPKKNWLRTNWNVGSPLNRFINACNYRTGTLAPDPETAANGQRLSTTGKYGIPRACRGHKYGLTATTPPLPAEVYETLGLVPYPVPNPGGGGFYAWFGPEHRLLDSVAQIRPVLGVCFFNGSKQIRCSDGETGTVPKTATKMRVHMTTGTQALWVLSVD